MLFLDSKKMTAPMRHRMGPVAIEGMELNNGLQGCEATVMLYYVMFILCLTAGASLLRR